MVHEVSDRYDGPVTFKRILVPVDLSDASPANLRFGALLAGAFQGSADVMYVWQSRLGTPVSVRSRQADEQVREFLDANKVYGSFKLRKRIEHGDPCMTILGIAALERFDAIVIGGAHMNEAPLTRSLRTTEELLRRAKCPVVVVPARTSGDAPIRPIQVACAPGAAADGVANALATAFGQTAERTTSTLGEGGPWSAIVLESTAVETGLLRAPPCPLVVCPP